MLSVLRYTQGDAASLRFGGLELIEGWERGGDEIIWVDFDGHDPAEERAIMAERFGINPLAIDDAQRDRHPPKLEWFDDDYFFLLLKGFTAETRSIDYSVVHISLFVGQNFFVTRHAIPSPSIEIVRSRIEGGRFDTSRATKHLCYRVVRTIIDRYSPIVLSLEDRLEEMEEQMIEAPSDALLAELVSYNSRLKKLRRTFGHQDTLLHELLHSVEDRLQPPSRHEFNDAHEQMARVASLVAMLQELTRDLIDGYLSISAHRLNNIMKVLTIASVIFLPLTFIAGIYGMNFANMPELQSRYGYFVVLGVLSVLAIALLAVFRRLRWL